MQAHRAEEVPLLFLIHRPDPSQTWQRGTIPELGAAIIPRGAGASILRGDPDPHAPALVVPFEFHGRPAAALLVRPGNVNVVVGGRQPLLLSVLEERSEILVGDATLYFTARRPLEVSSYCGEAVCGVCGDPVHGCQAIVCSGCGAVAHEGALAQEGERACFTHRGVCPGCELPRETFSWLPEEPASCSI